MKRPNLSRRRTRNALAVAVIVIVAPLIVAGQIYPSYRDYRNADATRPHTGSTVEFAGLRWSLVNVRKLQLKATAAKDLLPPHTEVWGAVVDITRNGDRTADRGPGLITCGVRLRAGDRYWENQPLGWKGWKPDRGRVSDCAGPGPLQSVFLIPAGTEPTSIDIIMRTRYPDFVRLPLPQ